MAVSVQLKKGETYGVSTRDRAKFGWLSVESVDLPYIVRDGREKFIPVKMVEKYILCYYPSTYPKELQDKPPLVCTFMKQEESDLLNKCCGKRTGFLDRFTKTDPVVKLNDFLTFFGFVKSAYPGVAISTAIASNNGDPRPPPPKGPEFGWVLVKDAMIPYIIRGETRFAPINVIRGAAQMLIGVQVDSTCATEPEVTCLNTMCQKVGLVFTFQNNTSLTNLRMLTLHDPQCVIQDLPKDNPMDFVNTTAAERASSTGGINQTANSAKKAKSTGTKPPPQPASTTAAVNGQLEQNRQSASRSLQALANMAKGQLQKSASPASSVQDPPKKKKVPTGTVAKPVAQKTSTVVQQSTEKSSSTSASTASTNSNSNKDTKSSVIIQPMECHGKTISCLIRGRSSLAFALVEAVCRVYFPTSSLVDFIHFMEMDLAVTLYILKKSEEDAFIDFYGIPTKQLRCNQVIKLKDLRDRMPRLVARFGGPPPTADQQQTAAATKSQGKADNKAQDKQSFTDNNASKDLHGKSESDVIRSESPLNGNDVIQQGEEQGKKTKSLENTIMRLLDKKQTNETEMDLEIDYELRDDRDSEREHSPKAPTNKRKATPRRCSPQKKVTLIIDGVRTEIEENPSTASDDSDMGEYA